VINSENSRLFDRAAGLPLILLSTFGVAGFAIQIHQQLPGADNATTILRIVSEIASMIFLAMQFVLVLVRRLPIMKCKGYLPRAWAIIGVSTAYLLLLLPRAVQSNTVSAASSVLLLVGTVGSVFTLFYLGRAFAILPQARQLAISGPYRIVRHPLYLFEQISIFGISLQFLQPWALVIATIGFALQLPRMRYEEEIMAKAFPNYRAYRERTPFILPGII
jgi:protein-S-isoprenylcysteine O-methyltransferase Ste14